MDQENSSVKFSLSLSGNGINLQREVDREIALRVINVILGGNAGAERPVADTRSASADLTVGVPLSLREYLDAVQPTKKVAQIVTIAHFMCEHEGAKDFAREDIRSRYAAAREPLPANFPRDFASALKIGWIATVHGKSDRFYITSKGNLAVENRFS